jgi:hypothetical protein
MGWIKKAAKWVAKQAKTAANWVAQKAKTVARIFVRVVMTFVGLALGIVDLFVGFLGWPPKKLRLQIVVLSDESGSLVSEERLRPAIDFARSRLKSRFGVELVPYAPGMVRFLDTPAPDAALKVRCNWGAAGDEFGDAGEFFARHLAGRNADPLGLISPITVFVVADVADRDGCSLGPLTDYVTVDPDGVDDPSLMTHEILHACNLLGHPVPKRNLQYGPRGRGDDVTRIQKNIFRSSRHVTYW